MAVFEITKQLSGKEEGGFASRSDDPGGYTYKGLTKKDNPNFKGWPIVAAWVKKYGGIKKAYNKTFPDPALDKLIDDHYLKNYWAKNNIGLINDQHIANHVYDFVINSGGGPSVINNAFGYKGVTLSIDAIKAINSFEPAFANKIIYDARYKYVTTRMMEWPQKSGKMVTVVSRNRGLLDRIERYKVWKEYTKKTNKNLFLNYFNWQF